jgi:hypothetical protein
LKACNYIVNLQSMSLLYNRQGFVIYYTQKYHKLIWELESESNFEFNRLDVCTPRADGAQSGYAKFFGFYKNFVDYELKIYLYVNRSITDKNCFLFQKKTPLPMYLLIGKGEDPSDFMNTLAHQIRQKEGVQIVSPVDFGEKKELTELIYTANQIIYAKKYV